MKLKKNEFVLTNWINGDYQVNWLRHIDYETKTQFVSNCQWTGVYGDRAAALQKKLYGKVSDKDFVYKKWSKHATRFRKTDRGGFARVHTRLDNPDGNLHITPLKNINELVCQYSFDHLFKTDVRNIWDKEEYKRSMISARIEVELEDKRKVKPEQYTLGRYVYPIRDNHWNAPLIDYLKELFEVSDIYCLHDYRPEWSKITSLLGRTVTFFHITKFTQNKQYCTFDEAYHNRTIAFWLFNGFLVFSYVDGIDSW